MLYFHLIFQFVLTMSHCGEKTSEKTKGFRSVPPESCPYPKQLTNTNRNTVPRIQITEIPSQMNTTYIIIKFSAHLIYNCARALKQCDYLTFNTKYKMKINRCTTGSTC